MIQHIDFAPKVTKKGGLFKSAQIESFHSLMDAMNEWISSNPIELVNVETVLLPNIYDSDEEGSEDTMLGTGRESSSHWYQLIRVWYKE
ncbi:hypothetical protein SAMN05421640_2532 [Ekhidna lutea]|uniref:Uncharacterized protein n=1 Tax=Ekhidna lutea TaxID=447679 RepID=A0A239K9S6_EKHLU|nr:hypothetical protein [Ekhidna lutea]SNT15137.1 hypothetical protein SAMN05421640_2532 [Ekhidna lutea]